MFWMLLGQGLGSGTGWLGSAKGLLCQGQGWSPHQGRDGEWVWGV